MSTPEITRQQSRTREDASLAAAHLWRCARARNELSPVHLSVCLTLARWHSTHRHTCLRARMQYDVSTGRAEMLCTKHAPRNRKRAIALACQIAARLARRRRRRRRRQYAREWSSNDMSRAQNTLVSQHRFASRARLTRTLVKLNTIAVEVFASRPTPRESIKRQHCERVSMPAYFLGARASVRKN